MYVDGVVVQQIVASSGVRKILIQLIEQSSYNQENVIIFQYEDLRLF